MGDLDIFSLHWLIRFYFIYGWGSVFFNPVTRLFAFIFFLFHSFQSRGPRPCIIRSFCLVIREEVKWRLGMVIRIRLNMQKLFLKLLWRNVASICNCLCLTLHFSFLWKRKTNKKENQYSTPCAIKLSFYDMQCIFFFSPQRFYSQWWPVAISFR